MIVDTVDNVNIYFGLSQELDCALSVLKNYILKAIDVGRYADFPIAGCNIELIVKEPGIVEDSSKIPWECHEKFIDVQWVLEGGTETIGYQRRSKIPNWIYHEENDTAFSLADSECQLITLEPGDFAIFFPQDAHKKISGTGDDKYRKIVIKVPVTGLIKSHKINPKNM